MNCNKRERNCVKISKTRGRPFFHGVTALWVRECSQNFDTTLSGRFSRFFKNSNAGFFLMPKGLLFECWIILGEISYFFHHPNPYTQSLTAKLLFLGKLSYFFFKISTKYTTLGYLIWCEFQRCSYSSFLWSLAKQCH